ncbi:hypothetical protein TSUD_50290 [Trifolium subterraneum]|uniref:Uncharacterized protein n=1 Tax=Trifolium subterraneum TaxID=3900 RepID=A0A2Z6MKE6_TRISU|nr:hypothetical protein TSUD_50290 [Trifolium subterraneum]
MLQVPAIHKINNFLNFLHLQSSSIVLNLCTWGALFLAILATFHTILIIKFRKNTPSSSISSLIEEDDFDFDDDDETCSLSSTEFEENDEEEEEQDENRAGEYFRLRGDGNGDGGFLRSCRQSIGDIFSLSEIANNKNVVKLWDTLGFGLGFGFDDSDSYDDGRIVSVYGTDEKQSVSPAGENSSENFTLGILDMRLRRRIPAVTAEWAPGIGNVGIESGGVQKVYVRDDGRYELTVGDMRNVLSPLGDLTESQLDLWWPNYCMLKI